MRLVWLAGGAVAMGGGIWSMHFVAMLAFRLPVPINYDVVTTLASFAAAVIVTSVGLFIVNRRPARWRNLVIAGTFMGLGISVMHYTGMAAMRVAARISYDPTLFVLSVLIAIVASVVALWMTERVSTIWTKIASGCVMGGAIAGMHYTAMAAAIYSSTTDNGTVTLPGMPPELLAMSVTAATFMILAFGLASSIADQRLAGEMALRAETLRRSERRLREVIEHAHDAIVIMDDQGLITAWNPQAEAIFGWSRDEAVGRRMTDLIVPPKHLAGHQAGIDRFRKTGKGQIFGRPVELTALHRSGREFSIEITVSALHEGDSTFFSGFIRDITQRQKVACELRDAKERAEAANNAKSAFLANVSHELRTPLNAIIGFSEVMSHGVFGTLDNSRYSTYIRDIHNSGSHLLNVINDILDISRAESNRLEIEDTLVDVGEAIAVSSSTVRMSAETTGINVTVECPNDLPALSGDKTRIQQILINLLSNAVKFTPRGGRVTVKAEIESTGGLLLTVTDTGIGMAPEQIAIAMSPFGQVDSRLARKYEGTGLGLPLTRRLVELHGGTLEISSILGSGMSVYVRFPARRVLPRPTRRADMDDRLLERL